MAQLNTSQQDVAFVKMIAHRMINPLAVKERVLALNNRNPDPYLEIDTWDDLSLAGGYTGVLPLFLELDRISPDERWDLVAHNYILKILESMQNRAVTNLSLFCGLAGTCFFIQQASKTSEKYSKVLNKLDDFLIERLSKTLLPQLSTQLKQSISPSPSLYEVIQGLSGIGIYLLTNIEKPEFKECVNEIIRCLILISNPIEVKGKSVPGWYISPDAFVLSEEKREFPNGYFNLGLSHGIAGVLSFLSIAMLHQVELKGQKEAIATISQWIQSKRKSRNRRFFWDATISYEEEVSKIPSEERKSRDTWCYGTPGIARSLYLAGKALKNETLKKFALESFSSIFKSSREEWNIPGPGVCHGIGGLLTITHLMARDSASSFLEEEVQKLRHLLLSYFDSNHSFGFKEAEPLKSRPKEYVWLDKIDLLEGVSGILLSLLSLHTTNNKWHLSFLIDD